MRAARVADKRIFVVVLSWTACESPHTRLKCFQEGANMVTASEPDLLSVLATIAAQGTTTMGDGDDDGEAYECPSCGLDGLTHHQLWVHHPLYHVNEPNVPTVCPLCPSPKKGKKPKYPSLLRLLFVQNRLLIITLWTPRTRTRTQHTTHNTQHTTHTRVHDRFPVHLFNTHAPPGAHTENFPDTSTALSLLTRIACIACANDFSVSLRSYLRLCVGRVPTVRRPVPACARVLQLWVLAARRTCRSGYFHLRCLLCVFLVSYSLFKQKGEDLTTAATRETKEEAGIDVELTGILRWEWAPRRSSRGKSFLTTQLKQCELSVCAESQD